MADTVIVLFRRDLRLADNAALHSAVESGFNVIPAFVQDVQYTRPGIVANWWLKESLRTLNNDLKLLASRLILRQGDTRLELQKLVAETGAFAIYLNSLVAPQYQQYEEDLQTWGKESGLAIKVFSHSLLNHPDEIKKLNGEPYQVFTPYFNACQREGQHRQPLPAPKRLPAVPAALESESIESLGLSSSSLMEEGFHDYWQAGERAAHLCLQHFIKRRLGHFGRRRDQLSQWGTSRLSPYLSWGQLSPAQIQAACQQFDETPQQAETFLRQLYWREFAYYTLYYFPEAEHMPLDDKFRHFPWRNDAIMFEAWTQGETGIPLVDAAMRELLNTGWMHQNLRMLVASVLSKNMLIDWRQGSDYFQSMFLDADYPCNILGWQWTIGCGLDGVPFFRILNPASQSEKYDAKGYYIRHWVPELARIPDQWLHRPWEAPKKILQASGIQLGFNYPEPVIDLKYSRYRALDIWSTIRDA